MKLKITSSCIQCGLCVSEYPQYFKLGETQSEPIVEDVPDDIAVRVQEDCPPGAIEADSV